ncbi:MAG: efflux RND transporter permease subunit [Deltaproteobacteria bacterium]|nr:efflux RND transporter permease subunit [Deltaproteobacteria bacterium]
MSISGIFIRRPVMTTLVMVAVLLFGVMGYRLLPVSDLPNVDFPAISVSASMPGASPKTMASAVATPLEKQFSTIAGIDSMNSSSVQGATQITLQFSLNRDIDAAAQDVQAAIARAARQLPANMPAPPSYSKANPADQPILMFALTSPTLPLSALDEYGQTTIAQRISMVEGVAQVSVYGSQKYAMRIQVDPRELASRGIGIDEVADAIDKGNSNLPTGILYGTDKQYMVQADGQLMDARGYRSLIVAYRQGAPVRLESLGKVLDSVENNKRAAWYCTRDSQERSVILAIQKQPGTNTVAVADAVNALIPTFRAQLPASVSLKPMYDRSTSIRDSARDMQFTLLLTLGLVVMVIFLFLRNVSATIIPSLALPFSIIGTFTIMYLLDYSIDNLSMMALTLAVGFVVDDAIVMLENIFRHMEMGKPRLQAALDASREIGFTIVSMTLSLAAVFIPVLFMGGIVGRLFREFAVTIGAAVLVSGAVSLTLTPMMSARFIRAPSQVRHGHIYAVSEAVYGTVLRAYGSSLVFVLRHRLAALLVAVAMLGGTFTLFTIIPKGFIPSEDRGMIAVSTEALEGISYQALVERQQAAAAIVQADPDVDHFMSSAGGGGGRGGANAGGMYLMLRDRPARKATTDEVIARLRPKLAQMPGMRVYMQNPPPISVGGQSSKSQYQFTLQDPDIDELYRYAAVLLDKFRAMPELVDVTSDMQLKNPELDVRIDRDAASSLDLTATQIEGALLTAYGSLQVSTIFAPNNEYQVLLEVLPEYQLDPKALSFLYVRASSGSLVPLAAVADMKERVGPLSINHFGQLPAVTVSFNLKPGVSIGDAVRDVEAVAHETLPPTVNASFQGTAQAFQSSLKGMLMLLVLAIVVIYMVLGVLYENFFHPVTILSALPFAGFGALLTLYVFGAELSIYAFVGIIMLVGLVKKNGIMMIDFAIEARREGGKSADEAIYEACMIRFRPIMMTTMAALIAATPIALGYGAGGESRRPLGLAVVGGLLFSQSLTLFVTPVFYVYMEKLAGVFHRRERDVTPSPAP